MLLLLLQYHRLLLLLLLWHVRNCLMGLLGRRGQHAQSAVLQGEGVALRGGL